MKRMVNQDIIEFIQELYDSKALGFDEGSNTLQVGTNLEVDGNAIINKVVCGQFGASSGNIKFDVPFVNFKSILTSGFPIFGSKSTVDGDIYTKVSIIDMASYTSIKDCLASLLLNADTIASNIEGAYISGHFASESGELTAFLEIGFLDSYNDSVHKLITCEKKSYDADFTLKFNKLKGTSEITEIPIFNSILYQYTDNLTAIANQAFRTIDMTALNDGAICINAVEVESSEGEVIDGVITSMPKWNGTNWQITLYNLSGASIADFKVNVTYFRILDTY